jgi:hypothetical protein
MDRYTDPLILDLHSRERFVISFTPRLYNSPERKTKYQLDKRLDGPRSQYRQCGEEKPFFCFAGNKLQFLSLAAINPSLYLLSCPGSNSNMLDLKTSEVSATLSPLILVLFNVARKRSLKYI